MAFFLHLIRDVNLILTISISFMSVLLVHLFAYLRDPHEICAHPGPFLAKFSDAWLGWVTKRGHLSEVVHDLHLRYGPFVRLAPNHVSIADPEALAIVYAHGYGGIKSTFYDPFGSFRRTMFSTRDRDEHARKRKMVAHIFSPRCVTEFQPQLCTYVAQLLAQWDKLYDGAINGLSGTEGESGWRGGDGRLWFDCLPWLHYLAFDIVGDLSFGAPFGMIEAAKDVALAPKRQEDVMNSYGSDMGEVETREVQAIHALIKLEEFATVLGTLPAWWHPIVRRLPWFRLEETVGTDVAGIAIMAVAERLATPTDRVDILSKLIEAGKDSNGNPTNRQELISEALSFIIAGSDTISNSSSAIVYHLARNPHIQDKLHKELDEQLGTEYDIAATCNQVKRLPYLDACINEGLRIHSPVAIGLPRAVPKGGLTILGQFFPEGTVLSVPIYSVHRDVSIWGEDADIYRPERWFEIDATAQKVFVPFSVGPRACVGRNLAFLELQIIIASIMRRYHFVLERPDEPLETREGFVRKMVECKVGLKRRDLCG